MAIGMNHRKGKDLRWSREDYKKRYSRLSQGVRSDYGNWHEPPQGWEAWWKFAEEKEVPFPALYDTLTETLAVFRGLPASELRKRTYEIANLPTFTLVQIAAGGRVLVTPGGRDSLDTMKLLGATKRAKGFRDVLMNLGEEILKDFEGLAFAINELAEPRVLLDYKHRQGMSEGIVPPSTNLSSVFPYADWRGRGGVWDSFVGACAPGSAARRLLVGLERNEQPEMQFSQTMAQVIPLQDSWTRKPIAPEALTKKQSKRRVIVKPSPQDKQEEEDGLDKREFRIKFDSSALSMSDSLMSRKSPEEAAHSEAFEFSNSLGSKSLGLCNDLSVRRNHGAFYSDWRTVTGLYPVFSHSKFDGFLDINFPSNWYYNPPKHYLFNASMAQVEFEDRVDQIFWRGSTTGGGNNPPRHQHSFQRHRLMRHISPEIHPTDVDVFSPSRSGNGVTHSLVPQKYLNSRIFDVAFTHLQGCGDQYTCNVTLLLPLYRFADTVPFSESAKWKVLLDIDGQAYSGRFLSLLKMGSAVMKSTLYEEFFSDYLIPWYHVIPISMEYKEIYNIFNYFLGLPDQEEEKLMEEMQKDGTSTSRKLLNRLRKKKRYQGDRESLKKIAMNGREWSNSVGSKGSMEAYTYRMLLEWRRLWYDE
ncbi:glycosyltransferase family 90 protein [Atractiella rhizophila]|nr:glycosyltransferase family 90 protein [Atractiella rhizophila]